MYKSITNKIAECDAREGGWLLKNIYIMRLSGCANASSVVSGVLVAMPQIK
jgi:hypothetical protein